jgi:hypothetical protein
MRMGKEEEEEEEEEEKNQFSGLREDLTVVHRIGWSSSSNCIGH